MEKPAFALFALLFWTFARLLPCERASAFGARLLAMIGPRLRKHKKIIDNLRMVQPGADAARLDQQARGVWRNFGAVLFEFPHLSQILQNRTKMRIGTATQALLDAGEPFLMVTGHLANWELLACYLGDRQPGTVIVYGPSKISLADRLMQRFRRASKCRFITKAEAIRQLTPKYLDGKRIGMVTDVRVDSSPMLPFFGVNTPTTITPARIALRLNYPFVPARVLRTGRAKFEIEICDPLTPTPEVSGKAVAIDLTCQFQQLLERWISERPEEWQCAKRRWPKGAAAS